MDSRTENAKRNILSGLALKVVSILLPFLVRTMVLYKLGEEVLGLTGVYLSILEVLNMVELGFSIAIVYCMYKPVAEDDTKTVCAILAYFRKVYTIVGSIILIGGLCIIPFLHFIIKGELPTSINIYTLYLLYLIDTCISYFLFGYKSSLLNAVQRVDIVSNTNLIVQTLRGLLQIVVIYFTGNYYIFMLVTICSTISSNLIIAYVAQKKFPQYICKGKIQSTEKNVIRKQVSGMLFGKLSNVSRNSFDTLIISSYIGLIAVTIYGNYYYIFFSIYAVMNVICDALQAGVGNSIAKETREKNYQDFLQLQFMFIWLVTWCSTCLLCLYQPFMRIWTGDKLMLSSVSVVLFVIYFYCMSANNIKDLYFNGNGLWWQAKYTYLFESILNLLLNIILGYFWGVSGVLIATICTIVIFGLCKRTDILFKIYFQRNSTEFHRNNVFYMIIACGTAFITYMICKGISCTGYKEIVVKSIICIIVPNSFMWLIYFKTKKWENTRRIIKQAIFRRGRIS